MMDFDEFVQLDTRNDLLDFLNRYKAENQLYREVLDKYYYEQELRKLQGELVNFQRWVQDTGKKVAIIFEGRDASGKGGTIKRFIEHLNPRAMRL